jgi:hypothetical protein
MSAWILTYTGTKFELADPKVEQIKLEDIAHALSQICRFTGHSKFFYSVAQHCLLGAAKMDEDGLSRRLQLLFMLHDAPEAYYADVNKPLKGLIGALYDPLEQRAYDVILEALGVETPTDEELKIVADYDFRMFQNEITHLSSNPEGYEIEALNEIDIEPMDIDEIKNLYAHVVCGLILQILGEKLVTTSE